jgi:hypothetical protein
VLSKARCQLAACCYLGLFLLLVGGANMTVFQAHQFYQRTLPETIGKETPLKLGCIIASDVPRNESAVRLCVCVYVIPGCCLSHL